MNATIQNLKTLIDTYIKTNGIGAITGAIDNNVRKQIVDGLFSLLGDPDDLDTIDKTSLVAAINELVTNSVVNTFIALTDTPSSYVGHSGKSVRVNGSETGLEFVSVNGIEWFMPLNKNIGRWDGVTSKIINSKAEETGTGIKVDGDTKAKSFIERSVTANVATTHTFDFTDLSGSSILTMTGNTAFLLSNMLTENEGVVFSFLLSGNYSPSFVSGIKTLKSDDYLGGTAIHRITYDVMKGGASPVIYYTIEVLSL
jgi:hypothetical protein